MAKKTSLALMLTTTMLVAGLAAGCGNNASNEALTQKVDSSATESAEGLAKSSSDQPAYPRVLKDEMGNEVTLPSSPAKIFAPNLEDTLVALGVAPVVQWSTGSRPKMYLQDKLKDVPSITFAGGLPPEPEAVMAHEPDLILLHNANHIESGVYDKYKMIAPTYVFKQANAELESSVRVVGDLLGKSAEAEQALQKYKEHVGSAKKVLAPHIQGKKAAIIRFNGRGMFFIKYDFFSGYVLTNELGFLPSQVVSGGGIHFSLESLPDLDADYIFLINDAGTGDAFEKELTESAVWKSMEAVKNGRTFKVEGDHWLSGGLIAHMKVIDDVKGLIAK
ncbi:ABC transporter substrate-binding protein [Brevibacillus brevis]|uniref:ABC transporter substrate-binding protein n=1 Tax=Brevibacillus brevis TaxID=1393 RepID=UPI000D107EF7|nr:ABC transporter substrate-binding protein [Brevibacillus brevis]PSJ70520.1 ferrichrome ABC transporter substrate-binding protein [Brevibacillus brevis]RED30853.1 iron complex transport system substrate-binding protein [Brevibacillus brevis]GEC88890.1 ferrichrome ABC transporter substrate-binding protein [Brevibacillus brevis]VEF89933.1 Probable siderophore-binding lipoprotein yfiY precursor [Brevibacillus brevis]